MTLHPKIDLTSVDPVCIGSWCGLPVCCQHRSPAFVHLARSVAKAVFLATCMNLLPPFPSHYILMVWEFLYVQYGGQWPRLFSCLFVIWKPWRIRCVMSKWVTRFWKSIEAIRSPRQLLTVTRIWLMIFSCSYLTVANPGERNSEHASYMLQPTSGYNVINFTLSPWFLLADLLKFSVSCQHNDLKPDVTWRPSM